MKPEPLQGNDCKQQFYLPHHAVFKQNSTTTKLRVVFEGSAKTSTGTSLNDILMAGPTVQQDLFSIMVRFRTHAVAFTADIEKMYRQIKIHPDDCSLQRILWRDSPTDQIQCYELQTVTYGTASAPLLATRSLQNLAGEEKHTYPTTARILCRDFYVDDLVSGANDINTALAIQSELIELLRSGGFQLRKWSSNHKSLLKSLPQELVNTKTSIQLEKKDSIQTLGFKWFPQPDVFSIFLPKIHHLKT
ncbi:uncharacterized protein LOC142319405 [Lycorma delicatula]|uniref:uncharacterized protein LOC142319405 n=1 Tax=Lycorma delicatula TaxID=130591 RepID=UPI003F50F786